MFPENIQKVPALLLISNKFEIIYGNDICNKLKENAPPPQKNAPQNGGAPGHGIASAPEPSGFSFGGGGSDIASDTFSYWDAHSDDLKTNGDGGMRQIHHYSFVDGSNCPVTKATDSDTTYKPNKINDQEYNNYQNSRQTYN